MPFTVRDFPNRTFDTIDEYKDFVRRREELIKEMEERKKRGKLPLYKVSLMKRKVVELLLARMTKG